MSLSNLNFLSLLDPFDPKLQSFRETIYQELGAPPTNLQIAGGYPNFTQALKEFPEKDIEELYKFSDQKWKKTDFFNFECAAEGNTIVSLSGTALYGRWLRIGMHHYTLKKFRKKHRALLFRKGGFLEKHLLLATNSLNLDGVFFSIYPHRSNLDYFVKNMEKKKFSPEGFETPQIKNIRYAGGPLLFNGVYQHFFYIPLKGVQLPVHEITQVSPTT